MQLKPRISRMNTDDQSDANSWSFTSRVMEFLAESFRYPWRSVQSVVKCLVVLLDFRSFSLLLLDSERERTKNE